MSETESTGSLRFPLLVVAGIAVVVGILAGVAESNGRDAMVVDVALGWVTSWIGILFFLLAPLVGVRMLRTKDLAWVVLLPVAMFLAGAALLGLGTWGPYVGLVTVVVVTGAIVLWRPSDDAVS